MKRGFLWVMGVALATAVSWVAAQPLGMTGAPTEKSDGAAGRGDAPPGAGDAPLAAGAVPAAETPLPPALPGPITEADLVQPEVVIREEGENLVTEYRVGGKPYLIKVTPPVGEPYYLIDRRGDGAFERLPGGAPPAPPMWVIKSWK